MSQRKYSSNLRTMNFGSRPCASVRSVSFPAEITELYQGAY
jgi:hypothetical protein